MTENPKAPTSAAVIVGVDGSAGSAEALRWALAEARIRTTRLRVVHAVTFDYPIGDEECSTGTVGVLGSFSPNAVINQAHAAAEGLLERMVAEIAKDADGVEIERQLITGSAVGSRGHGGFTELLLGSVSHQCAHHAPCPVVIVRAGDTAR